MRRYLRPSAVNGPVSAWGLYKSDDDQTHSDDLCCRGGWRGGNFAPAGAGLSAPFPCSGLFDGPPPPSPRRLSRPLTPPPPPPPLPPPPHPHRTQHPEA